MKFQRAWIVTLTTIVALVFGASTAQGQFPGVHHPPGFHPAANPYSVMMGQEGYDSTWIGEANYGNTCCGPNWYDFFVEAVYMKRDDAGRDVPYTSDGIAGLGPPNIVLSSNDLDFDYELGVRAFARYQISAVHNVEIGFLGAIDWRAFASATSNTDSLFSAFSNFGTAPFGGFDNDVDQASLQTIDYSSQLDTVEINYRRSWASPRHRIHGSWLTGFRFMKVQEDFHYSSVVLAHIDPITLLPRGPGQADYFIAINNDLYGFQTGADLGVCLLPGLNVVGEIKAGAYANRVDQDSRLNGTSLAAPVVESTDTTDTALIAEAGGHLIYQIHPMVKIGAGYQFLFVDGLALGPENFNSQPPDALRTVTINDNGNIFYHGGTVRLEIGW